MVSRAALFVALAGTMALSAPAFADMQDSTSSILPVSADSRFATTGVEGTTLLAQAERPVVYRPPLRGAPTRRVGGATRGDEEWDLNLAVLAPEETGLSARASPVLYWYLSKDDNRPAVFALIRDDWIEPVVELNLGERTPAGMGKVALADANVQLEPGILYEWSIALVTDFEARSKDVVSSATLLVREPAGALRRDLEVGNLVDKAVLYAGAGYWYDAIDALSAGIDAGPEAAVLRSIRADLLEQVGLDEAAGFDRTR